MLRLILMTVCLLVVYSEACKEHEECPLDLEILDNGDLAIEYHGKAIDLLIKKDWAGGGDGGREAGGDENDKQSIVGLFKECL